MPDSGRGVVESLLAKAAVALDETQSIEEPLRKEKPMENKQDAREILRRLQPDYSEPAGRTASQPTRQPAPNAVFKALDDRVAAAEERLEKARSDIERSSAATELQAARQQRMTAKMIAGDNARARGQLPQGRFGPGSAELFKESSINSLPDDVGLHYVGR